MPVYPSGGTIAQSVGSPGFGPAPTPTYNASASVRLNPADSAYFSYVPTLQGSRTTWTWSGWVKRSVLGNTYQELFGTPNGASDATFLSLTFGSNGIADTLGFQIWNSTYRTTTQVFRDTAQWYHILLALDTTQSTAADRVKLYVNGTQITAFSTSNNPAQFAQLSVNVAGSVHAIGRDLQQSINFGGYLADINFIDGLALTPSSFTSTDTNTGQLVPIQYTGNRGTNGFYLPFSGAALAVDLGQNPKTTAQDFPYWPYNTLLVNTTSTNGAQNNTFLDSSTNNFTITRNGNTTQGNFTPFNYGGGTAQTDGYYSGYFDGTGDYLNFNGTTLNVGTGSFTLEGWVYITSYTFSSVISTWNSLTAPVGFILGLDSSGRPFFSIGTASGAGSSDVLGANAIPLNVWTHLAATKTAGSGGTMTLYVNGVSVGTNTTTRSVANTAAVIGRYYQDTNNYYLNGYISNVRVVTGSVVYASNFTVPTTPLTAISGTQVLTCQSSQFIDNSTNAFAITANGNAQPLPTNPFNMTNWSGFFDGTGDYLSVPTNTNTNLHQIGNWTYEGWISWNSMPTTGYQNVFGQGVAGQNSFGLTVYNGSTWSAPYYFVVNQANIGNVIVGTTPLVSNVWYHFAVVRNSGVVRLYVNGRAEGSPLSNSTSYAFGGSPFTIGNSSNGQISNFRFVRSAVYTANFTPPTAPLTAITNTQLLTCQNSTFIDNSPNNYTVTVVGNSYTGTLNNPFGNPMNYNTPPVQAWSTYFDGNGDYISSPSGTPTYNLGMGLWTWEAWINTNSTATTQTVWQYYCTNIDVIAAVVNGSTGVVSFNVRATNRTDITTSSPSGSIKLNQWHHIAMVRDSGTNMTCYIDGKAFGVIALAANASFSDTVMFTGNPTIGAKTNVVTNYFSGYISNLRFVRGSAVYTANFTPPTAPLTAIPGTMTLACQSNRVLDNSILNVAQVGNGNTAISPVSPFIPTQPYTAASYGGTMYFDGSDYLTAPHDASLSPTGNFTIEFWAYNTGSTAVQEWVTKGLGIQIYSFNSLWYAAFSSNNTTTYFINASFGTSLFNTWQHIAVTRSGNTYTGFVNGVATSLGTSASAPGTGTSLFAAGVSIVGTPYYVTGYMSGLRVINGTALYTTPFVPPVLPPTAIANTSLLLNATNSGIYDAAGDNVLETVGNAQVSTAVKKWGTSSVYFDGSGDALLVPATERMAFGTGDFTVEAWVYPTTTQGQYANIICNTNNPNGWFLSFSTGNLITFSNYSTVAITSSSGLSNNAWTHVAVSRVGTTIRMFFNGVQVASATNSTTYGVATSTNYIGFNGTLNYFLGYLQDVRVTKGVGRYQGNFTPPAAAFAYNQYDIGNQQWLPNNISVTAGVGQDNLVDSPSDYGTDTGLGGQVRGNYATWNPLLGTGTLSNGNLQYAGIVGDATRPATIGVSSGKWYAEFNVNSALGTTVTMGIAVYDQTAAGTSNASQSRGYFYTGQKYSNGSLAAYGNSFTNGDVIGVALDLDAGKVWFSKNGVFQASGDPVAGTNAAYTDLGTTSTWFVSIQSGGSAGTSASAFLNAGQRAFAYTAPTGFKCLVSTNLPTPTIGTTSTTQADDYFNVNTWTGNGSQVTVGFNPELLWYKSTNAVDYTGVVDVLRGDTKYLQTWTTNAEGTTAGLLTKNSTGFVPGTAFSTNSYVSWSWKANGAGVANTAGTIASTVSANTTNGCSIVSFSFPAVASKTVGHGLGVSPSFIVVKSLSNGTQQWITYHSSLGNTGFLCLNKTDGFATNSSVWDNTSPTSTVFTLGSGFTSANYGANGIAYCFAPVSGFSAMGSYTGNGAADGPMIYTNFRPAFVMVKNTVTAATSNWIIKDELRAANYNPATGNLYANLSNSQDVTATVEIDLLSNGFKVRGTYAGLNGSGNSIVYIAFAEFPFKYSRAR